MTQVSPPQHFGDLGHAHRHAGMARVRLLHGIHGQRAKDVDDIAVLAASLCDSVTPVTSALIGSLLWDSCEIGTCSKRPQVHRHEVGQGIDHAVRPGVFHWMFAS